MRDYTLALSVLLILGGGLASAPCMARAQETQRRSAPVRRIPVRKEVAVPVEEVDIHFPWPPASFSARAELPESLFVATGDDRLSSYATRIQEALARAGVQEWAIYMLGDTGFVYVTRLERIDAEGRPFLGQARWPKDWTDGLGRTSFKEWLRSLFVAEPGYYRVVALLVTSRQLVGSGPPDAPDHAFLYSKDGLQHLPASLADKHVKGLHATALIYHYQSAQKDMPPSLLTSSNVQPLRHLMLAGYWTATQLGLK